MNDEIFEFFLKNKVLFEYQENSISLLFNHLKILKSLDSAKSNFFYRFFSFKKAIIGDLDSEFENKVKIILTLRCLSDSDALEILSISEIESLKEFYSRKYKISFYDRLFKSSKKIQEDKNIFTEKKIQKIIIDSSIENHKNWTESTEKYIKEKFESIKKREREDHIINSLKKSKFNKALMSLSFYSKKNDIKFIKLAEKYISFNLLKKYDDANNLLKNVLNSDDYVKEFKSIFSPYLKFLKKSRQYTLQIGNIAFYRASAILYYKMEHNKMEYKKALKFVKERFPIAKTDYFKTYFYKYLQDHQETTAHQHARYTDDTTKTGISYPDSTPKLRKVTINTNKNQYRF